MMSQAINVVPFVPKANPDAVDVLRTALHLAEVGDLTSVAIVGTVMPRDHMILLSDASANDLVTLLGCSERLKMLCHQSLDAVVTEEVV